MQLQLDASLTAKLVFGAVHLDRFLILSSRLSC